MIGTVALTFSASMFCYFIRSRAKIGKAVAYMLAGECIGIAMTLVFCVFANGVYDFLGDHGSMFLRWVMFTAAIASSVHLAYRTRQIELQLSDDEDGSK